MGMRVERGDGYWLLIGGPVPRGASAITIGPVISMRERAVGNERLLRHELEHVKQWRRFGPIGFLVRYLRPYVKWRLRGYPHWGAYRRIPFEIEAEWTARRSLLESGRGSRPRPLG
jgi:Domain of unknown function (DUF4157)